MQMKKACRAGKQARKRMAMPPSRHYAFSNEIRAGIAIEVEYELQRGKVGPFVVRLMFVDDEGKRHCPSRFDNTHDEKREPHMDVLTKKDSNHDKIWHREWNANEAIKHACDYYKANYEWLIAGYKAGWRPSFARRAAVEEVRPWEAD